MSQLLIEKSLDVADGVKTVFRTPCDYAPGSVRLIENGMLQTATLEDGWTELGGNKVKLKEAPELGDVIMFAFRRL